MKKATNTSVQAQQLKAEMRQIEEQMGLIWDAYIRREPAACTRMTDLQQAYNAAYRKLYGQRWSK